MKYMGKVISLFLIMCCFNQQVLSSDQYEQQRRDREQLTQFQRFPVVQRSVCEELVMGWHALFSKKHTYGISSGSRGVAIDVPSDSIDTYQFVCARTHNDTGLVVDTTMKDGSHRLLGIMLPYDGLNSAQINVVQDRLQGSVRAKAVVVGVNGDEHNWLAERDGMWANQLTALQKLGVNVHFVPYQMVPGTDFRDINHFNVEINRGSIVGNVVSRGCIKKFEIPRSQV